MIRVLVCGDRHYADIRPIRRELKKLVKKHGIEGVIVIAGKASGADQMAAVVAEELDIHCAEVKPLWNGIRRKSAGPKRNDAMLALEPDLVLAFHENLAVSRGTADTVRKARKADIKTRVIKR